MNKSVGLRAFEWSDKNIGSTFPILVMYPSNSPEKSEKFGPYTVSVAMDGPIEDGPFPLIVISHGSGGSHLVYRTLAAHLARHGFVVAMAEHPGNNKNNNHLAGTVANLANRPRHIRGVIDRMFSSEVFGRYLMPGMVAIVGHSMGGYTALALAGGVPTAFAHETRDQQSRRVEVDPDDRVKALVLLAPATVWFMAPGALSGVRVPILMLTAEKDALTPGIHAEVVESGVPDKSLVEHRVIANAGHFSFLSPFPEAMVNVDFLPSQDPAGFDRVGFTDEMNTGVLEFLKRTLPLVAAQ